MSGKQAVVGMVGAQSGPRSGAGSIDRLAGAFSGAVRGWVRLVTVLSPSVLNK